MPPGARCYACRHAACRATSASCQSGIERRRHPPLLVGVLPVLRRRIRWLRRRHLDCECTLASSRLSRWLPQPFALLCAACTTLGPRTAATRNRPGDEPPKQTNKRAERSLQCAMDLSGGGATDAPNVRLGTRLACLRSCSAPSQVPEVLQVLLPVLGTPHSSRPHSSPRPPSR